MSDFPTHADAVTREWFASAIGVAPSRWSWEPVGTGQVADSVRFHLAYENASGPRTVVAKFPAADDASRTTSAMLGLYRKEVLFYRELAGSIATRTPSLFAAELSDDGAAFVLLFEDLGPARGGDQLAGCTLEDARHAIRQAAALHAPSWHYADLLERDWLCTDDAAKAQVRTLYPRAQTIFRDRYADRLEPEFMALCDALASSERWLDHQPERVCLVHGDFRLDNMLFDVRGGAEPIAVLDWQTLTVGNGLTDIGYLLGCGIGDTMRRAHEDELLDLYCAEMTASGVALTRSDIARDYAIGALHGVSTAVFSAAFVERTQRGDENFLSMARGACASALEHDSLGRLEED